MADEAARYLGDGVYARHIPEDETVVIYLDNGEKEYNHIYLEPEVCVALVDFLINAGMY